MRTTHEIQSEIDSLTDELIDIHEMTEEEAMLRFNVDSKEQIIAIDNELLVELTEELAEAQESEDERFISQSEEYFGSELAMNLFLY